MALGQEPQLAGVTASDMLSLTWDSELARGAQLWADQCVFQHDNNDVCRSENLENYIFSAREAIKVDFLIKLIFFQSGKYFLP